MSAEQMIRMCTDSIESTQRSVLGVQLPIRTFTMFFLSLLSPPPVRSLSPNPAVKYGVFCLMTFRNCQRMTYPYLAQPNFTRNGESHCCSPYTGYAHSTHTPNSVSLNETSHCQCCFSLQYLHTPRLKSISLVCTI